MREVWIRGNRHLPWMGLLQEGNQMTFQTIFHIIALSVLAPIALIGISLLNWLVVSVLIELYHERKQNAR